MNFKDIFRNNFGPSAGVIYEQDAQWSSTMIDPTWKDDIGDCIALSREHSVLTAGLLFVCRIFAQADISLYNTKTGEKIESHDLLDLIKHPNQLQSTVDFLEDFMFMKLASGVSHINFTNTAIEENAVMRVLDTSLIDLDYRFKFKDFISGNLTASVVYDKQNNKQNLKQVNISSCYDMPLVASGGRFNGKSRIDSIIPELKNIIDTQQAKNKIIRTNGKEMISSKTGSAIPLTPDEKREVEASTDKNYGLTLHKNRAIVTKSSLEWTNMTVPLRDLGLDEATKADADIVLTCLNIPRDLHGLSNKRSTYNNVAESYVGYIESEMQSNIDDLCDTLNRRLTKGKDIEFRGSYDHLPFMIISKEKKYKSNESQAKALKAFLDAGVSWDDSLRLVGLPKNTVRSKKTEVIN